VSAFGISGTNAHIILEEAPREEQVSDGAAKRAALIPLTFSAATTTALAAQAGRLLSCLDAGTDPADMGYSLATTRARLEHRAVVFGADRDDLAALASGRSGYAIAGRADPHGRTAFVFPGHGAQWAGMAAELLDSAPVFAAAMAECETVLSEFVDWSLAEAIADESVLRRPEVVQPAVFAVTISLARLWQWHGVIPDAVIGHSFGEISAAHVAGVLSLRDAARIVVRRGALCAGLDGRMLSVEAPAATVSQRISEYGSVSIAAYNGPSTTVLAGDTDTITALMTEYRDAGVPAHFVQIGFASHSIHVEPIRDRLLAELSGIRRQPTRIPWYSTVTGQLMTEADGDYWYDNLRRPVRFTQTVATLAAAGFNSFIEVGPHPVLATMVAATAGDGCLSIGSIRRRHGGMDQFATALARGYVRGLPVDWAKFFERSGARQIDLPTYPFQRRRYWLDRTTRPSRITYQHPKETEAESGTVVVVSNSLRDQLAALGRVEQVRLVEDLVRARAAAVLGHHDPYAIAADHNFLDIGFDSLTAMELHDTLSQITGLALPPIPLFEAETPTALAQRLLIELLDQPDPKTTGAV
jgi:acyl transferase domain-containing protein